MKEEIELIPQLWQALKKRWIIAVVLPVIALLVTGIISLFIIKPIYETSTTLIVGKKIVNSTQGAEQMIDYHELLASQKPAKTYIPIVQSRVVEQNVLKDLRLSLNVEEFDKLISVNVVKNTDALEITVTNTNPELATLIANTTAKEFSKAVPQDSVGIIDEAVTPINPIENDTKRSLLLALMLSLGASGVLIFLLEYLDNTIKTINDVENILDIPILGIIHNYGNGKKRLKGEDFSGRFISYLKADKISKY